MDRIFDLSEYTFDVILGGGEKLDTSSYEGKLPELAKELFSSAQSYWTKIIARDESC